MTTTSKFAINYSHCVTHDPADGSEVRELRSVECCLFVAKDGDSRYYCVRTAADDRFLAEHNTPPDAIIAAIEQLSHSSRLAAICRNN